MSFWSSINDVTPRKNWKFFTIHSNVTVKGDKYDRSFCGKGVKVETENAEKYNKRLTNII